MTIFGWNADSLSATLKKLKRADRLSALLCALLFLFALRLQGVDQGPLTPEQALRAFQVDPGLVVEVVAAEPVDGDPAALAFDERGQVFFAETRGYPLVPEPYLIVMLEDKDADGRFEKITVFAECLTFPNGVL